MNGGSVDPYHKIADVKFNQNTEYYTDISTRKYRLELGFRLTTHQLLEIATVQIGMFFGISNLSTPMFSYPMSSNNGICPTMYLRCALMFLFWQRVFHQHTTLC